MSITPREPADFTPSRGNYTELKPFRFWCQKVLPLVYDDSLSYYELLCKVVDFLNKTMEDVETLEGDVTGLHTAYVELQTYVNDYFASLDVQEEINNKLDEMAESGALNELIDPLLPALIAEWLADHLTPTSPPIDNTLSVQGAGADSKTVGDNLSLTYAQRTYNVNDIVLYNGKLYKCNTAIAAGEAWNANKWTSIDIGSELTQLIANFLSIQYSVTAFDYALTSTAISDHGLIPDVRALDSNYIYTLGGDAHTVLANLPAGFEGLGTLFKFTGTRRSAGGYATYLLCKASNLWYGFDGGSSITWKKVCNYDELTNYETKENALYNVKPFAYALTSSTLTEHNISDVRTLESNYVYTLGGDAYTVLSHLPSDFSGIGTLFKFTGTRREGGGYATYLLCKDSNLWYGFDGGSSITWKKVCNYDTLSNYETRESSLYNVKAFDYALTSATITGHSLNPDVRTLDSNYVYTLGADAYTVLANLPADFISFGTLFKFTGTRRSPGGYATYILATTAATWLGFDNGSRIFWKNAAQSKFFVLVGDSYAEGYSHDGTNDGWASLVQSYYADSTALWSIKYNGGAGFANTNNNFLSLVNQLTSQTGVTDIIVCGGFNDVNYTQAEIETAISNFITSVKQSFPLAVVKIGFIGWIKQGSGTGSYEDWETKRSALINNVLPAYKNCVKYGGVYLGNVEYLLNDSLITNTDGYHPSQAGNESVAVGIVEAMKAGSACLPYKESLRI